MSRTVLPRLVSLPLSRTCLVAPLLLALACDGASKPADSVDAKTTESPSAEAKPDKNELGAFDEYQRKSMTSEAVVKLAGLGDAVATYVMEERVVPGSTTVVEGQLPPAAPLTPAPGTCCKQAKGLCPAGSVDWSHVGFKALEFALDEAHRYSYAVDVKGDTVTVRAEGDLDCDGTPSSFKRAGTLVDGAIRFGEIEENDPLE